MARQRKIGFCREGICYALVTAAVLIGANYRQINLLMLVGSMLAGPLLFSLLYGRFALRRIQLDRKLPANLHSDQRLVVDIALTNHRRWFAIWTIEVEDHVRRDGSGEASPSWTNVGVFFPRVAGQETKQVSYQGLLPQRGRYHFGPLKVSTRFPLGLIRHSLVLERHDSLLVHPKLGRLEHDWADAVHEDERGTQRMQRRGLLEADFFGLRDYRPGDSRRWIHWRTTARRGSLVVRQFEQRRSQDLCLLVDLWQSANPTDRELENVETAVSLVATIIAEACRLGSRKLILKVAADVPLERAGAAAAYFFREQMDALALIAPHQNQRFPTSLGHALALVSSSTPTLLVSTRAIDWRAFESAVEERNVQLANRQVQSIEVGSAELAQYFHE